MNVMEDTTVFFVFPATFDDKNDQAMKTAGFRDPRYQVRERRSEEGERESVGRVGTEIGRRGRRQSLTKSSRHRKNKSSPS